MKKFLTYFFVTLGVLFFIIICAGAYIWFADPFEIRPFISVMMGRETTGVIEASLVDKNPALSPAQESALEKIGIDPATLPTSITPEMEDCFVSKLGESRVSEIKAGDSPTPTEIFVTRSCYE